MRIRLLMIALVFAIGVNGQLSQSVVSAGTLRGEKVFISYQDGIDPQNGSRLLFESWSRGYVLGAYDTVLKNPRLFLNYDKINHNLYFTFDGITVSKVSTDQARELHFEDIGGHIILERVRGLDPRIFYERLSDSAGESYYILYRQLKTQYHRSLYYPDCGEYTDSYHYYLVMPGGREYAPIKLKRKSIREVLGSQAEAWLATQGELNESGLTALVNRLNANN